MSACVENVDLSLYQFSLAYVLCVHTFSSSGIHEFVSMACGRKFRIICLGCFFVVALESSLYFSWYHLVHMSSRIRNVVLYFGTFSLHHKVRTKTEVPTVRSIVVVRRFGGRQMFLFPGLRVRALQGHLIQWEHKVSPCCMACSEVMPLS